jgi:hypothetical protein
MGGLYNIVFGENPFADAILATLDLDRTAFRRFRDVFVTQGQIAVYTRCGGGNREAYMPDFTSHPCYLRDVDDEFDNTYATIYFSFPEAHKEQLAAMDNGVPFNPSQRWKDAIAVLKQGKK